MLSEESEDHSAAYRDFFAAWITSSVGVGPGHLRAAFASTPRERFLGKGPWKILTSLGYIDTPSDDPAFVYHDAAIALEPQASINNGQPSLHALCLAALNIREGETVTHIGAGTGYYTAILSKLTGPQGCVYAFEIEPGLARRAVSNLADATNVTVYDRSGSEGKLPDSDVVYVSAGATGPQSVWLDALRDGGRLLFPLTATKGTGAMLLVKRRSARAFEATFLCSAVFIGCAGARDEDTARRLSTAFSRGDLKSVQSLKWNSPPDETCWFAGRDWWLSSARAG
jgi:protein-L-isoaspartate(D-aspartate) O-methyltransferase